MFKKVIENTIFIVLLVILGISVSPALPFKNIPRTYVVVSGSMEPTIKTGSIVLTKPVNPKEIKVGDIVAFTSPSNSKDVILHRIFGIKSESPLRFSTKGDNNNSPDAWDLMDVGILGKQVYAVPYIGHIAAFVRKPLGFGLIIVLPALLFIIFQILNIKKYIKEEIDKQVKSKTIPLMFFFLSMFSVSSLFFTTFALAKLTSTATVSGTIFSTKDFAPPVTILDSIPPNTNTSPLTITYTSDDSDIDHVDLCYYFNDGIVENCSPNFDFNFPDGEGTYYFFTRAIDTSGNTEDPNIDLTNATIYDITPPTTNYVVNTGSTSFSGLSLLSENNWTIIGNGQSLADNSFQLGIGDSDSIDYLIQRLLLPQNLSSSLTFSYNYSSDDISEYDNLSVGVSTINSIFPIFSFGGTGTTGWQTISHSLAQWAGKTVDIFFKLTNSAQDMTLSTNILLKDIFVYPLDLRTGDTTPAEFLATDLGVGIDTSPAPTDISIGDTQINISSIDLATNIESEHSISIVTLPPVVLNKISSSTVTIYNNTDSAVDLSTYSLDVGTTTILSGTIPSFTSQDISLTVGTTSVGLLNNSFIVDSTTFEPLSIAIWQRQSDGLGPWTRINAPMSFDLQSRLSQSKITFTVSGLGTTLANMNYEILYTEGIIPRQIAGTILPHTIDSNGTASRDFFLGTCSSGSCTPASGIGSSFVVTFSGTTKTFILN